MNTPFLLRDTVTDTLTGRSLIVAAPTYIDDLRVRSAGQRLEAATLLALDPDAAIPASTLANVRVLVLEVDAENDASLRRLASVRVSHPQVAIIAALEQTEMSLVRALVRQGVADVAQLPFAPDQLEEQVLDALSTQAETSTRADVGKAIVVVGTSGGCGATSVLTHLAGAMAKSNTGHRGVCLLDLDLQRGAVSSYLGGDPVVTFQDLIDAGVRLDRALMMSAVTQTNEGFSYIAAPSAISPIDRIDVDHLLQTIELVRAEFDYVLIDLPPIWTEWSLSLISWASRVVLLTDCTISGLRQTKRTIDLLGSVDVPVSRVSVVANKVERRVFGTMRMADVARALGNIPVASVTDAGPSLRSAQDQGLLLHALQSKSRFAADVSQLASSIIEDGGW